MQRWRHFDENVLSSIYLCLFVFAIIISCYSYSWYHCRIISHEDTSIRMEKELKSHTPFILLFPWHNFFFSYLFSAGPSFNPKPRPFSLTFAWVGSSQLHRRRRPRADSRIEQFNSIALIIILGVHDSSSISSRGSSTLIIYTKSCNAYREEKFRDPEDRESRAPYYFCRQTILS